MNLLHFTIRYQTYFRRQSNRHTNISVSIFCFDVFVFIEKMKIKILKQKTKTEVNCNARHKDLKNKRILPQKQSKITNFVSSRQQLYFRRQSNRHTNLSIFYFFVVVAWCNNMRPNNEEINHGRVPALQRPPQGH